MLLRLVKPELIQDAAYQSLLRRTRQQYHQRVAQVLERRFPETVETQPELLAYHYTEAGWHEQAVSYWQRAGRRAYERFALAEAMHYLRQGLGLLQGLPDTPGRAHQEFLLQTTLGAACMAAKGYASVEVAQAYGRARELCRYLGETPPLFRALAGMCMFYVSRVELKTAQDLGEQCLSLAQTLQDSTLLLRAHFMLGGTLFWIGELSAARQHLEQSLSLYASQYRHTPPSHSVKQHRVTCLAYTMNVLWLLGYPDQARRRSQEALSLAAELAYPLTLAWATNWAAWLDYYCRAWQAVQERAEATIALATDQAMPWWLAMGQVLRGWARTMQGHGAAGIAEIQQGLAAWTDTGAELVRPYYLALLAEAYGHTGQTAEALHVLEEALEVVHTHGERVWAAEIYRLKGEFLLVSQRTQCPRTEAEASLQCALDIARQQQAKSLELRAAMSLSRLWQQQGKRHAARQLLSASYGWFSEGFDTTDLQEARALLKTLT
jgi:predicted ATPase